MKKQLAVVAFLAGAGAAAMNGAAQAHADTPPPPPVDTEMAAVPHGQSVRERILNVARQEFDKQNPGTFYSEGVRQAWCANFVSWVMKQAGDPLTNVSNGSWRVPGVYTLRDTFAATNKLEPVGYKPAPGDVVLYGGSGHTNIVVGVEGDNITTIGGNESNRISQRTISRFSNNIMGFGRVAETPPSAPEVVSVATEPNALPAPPPPAAVPLLPPPAPEFAAPPVDPFLPPPPVDLSIQPAVFDAPPPPTVEPLLPPPAPGVIPVVNEVPVPPVDPFLPPPAPEVIPVAFNAPAPEVAPVVGEVPPPPPPVEFLPPAPEVVPAVFDAPPPPAPEVIELSAPVEGVPHLTGALPGPAA